MAQAFLSIGSNEGDRAAMLRFGLDSIVALDSTAIEAVSPLYESAPWGRPDQPSFLNAVARIETTLSPRELLQSLKRIEWDAGRRAGIRWGPRPLDIDILLYEGGDQTNADLTIPHASMAHRRFVLEPLQTLWPADNPFPLGSWDDLLHAVSDQGLTRVADIWWPSPE